MPRALDKLLHSSMAMRIPTIPHYRFFPPPSCFYMAAGATLNRVAELQSGAQRTVARPTVTWRMAGRLIPLHSRRRKSQAHVISSELIFYVSQSSLVPFWWRSLCGSSQRSTSAALFYVDLPSQAPLFTESTKSGMLSSAPSQCLFCSFSNVPRAPSTPCSAEARPLACTPIVVPAYAKRPRYLKCNSLTSTKSS